MDVLAARRGLRLRDRHLLRGRQRTTPSSTTSTAPATCSTPRTSASGSAGLAYNPTTRHLFVVTRVRRAVRRLGARSAGRGYTILGGFRVTSGGVPVLPNEPRQPRGRLRRPPLAQSTRSADRLRASNRARPAGASTTSRGSPRIPTEGTVRRAAARCRSRSRSTRTGLLPGLRQGSLIFTTDTPTPVAPVPVDFTILFNDVPQGSFAWNYIYGAAGAGVMPGCAPQTPTFTFCPAEVVTRRSMAGFIERAVHGALTPPPVYLGEFDDVLAGQLQRQLHPGPRRRRDHGGLQRRAAALLPGRSGDARADGGLRVEGPARRRAAAGMPTGTFADVPCPGGFAVDYIEGIYAEGITAGCGNGELLPEREHHERADGRVPGQGVPDLRTCHEDPHEETGRNRNEPAVDEEARGLDPLCGRARHELPRCRRRADRPR